MQMMQPSSRRSSMKISFFVLFRFQLISSGVQSGRSGICVAFGVVLFYFGSVVGPWLYLDDVKLYLCIVWSGDCKPTMYLFPYCITWVVYEDYLTCDIAFNAVMPLSHASIRGRYSRIEGVTTTMYFFVETTCIPPPRHKPGQLFKLHFLYNSKK